MARKTVVLLACDVCDRELRAAVDGLVFVGDVHAPGEPEGCRAVVDAGALCWACFHRRVEDPVLAAERAKKQRVEVRTEYVYEKAGGGISGPLPPPELPHAVAVVAALCGVSPR